ncbi:hypothetical protein [Nonomuraea sp. NPDC050786]|uniref:hypothetical protein n=1 Tax=Nonomuraea sp. NPDC050786 TaxID=3154840 RepID=UPI0033D68085
MANEKSRGRRRISIDGAGLERRRTAIQTLVDEAPQPGADQVAPPVSAVGAGPDDVESVVSVVGAGPDDVESVVTVVGAGPDDVAPPPCD